MTNESVHPAPETGKVQAHSIVAAAQNITLFGQLYLMIKAMKHHGKEAGVPVELNTNYGRITINSNIILPALLSTFQEIGDNLEKNSIDVSRTLESLEAQFQQVQGNNSP